MDSTCVTMPSTLYEFLQAMCAIQDYSLQVAVGAQRELKDPGKHRDPHYQITFRMNKKFKYFEPALRVVHDNIPIFDYTGWNEQQRGDYDCYIRFDADMFERAKSISQLSGSHITVGLNHLIGSGSGPLPVLNALQIPPVQRTVTPVGSKSFEIGPPDTLVLPWDSVETERFVSFLRTNYPALDTIYDARDIKIYEEMPESLIQYVNHYRCVIGPRCSYTYIAAALKKTVIELFSSNEEGRLY